MSRFTDVINRGLAALLKTAGEPVVYERSGAVVEIDAIPASFTWDETMDPAAMTIIESKAQDWIFRTDAIERFASPKPGDLISLRGTARRYEAMSIPGGQPWRYIDTGRQWIRLHTTQVTTGAQHE